MDIFTWLFNTREGVCVLLVAGIICCFIVAFVLEKRGKKRFYDHPEEPDEDDE